MEINDNGIIYILTQKGKYRGSTEILQLFLSIALEQTEMHRQKQICPQFFLVQFNEWKRLKLKNTKKFAVALHDPEDTII